MFINLYFYFSHKTSSFKFLSLLFYVRPKSVRKLRVLSFLRVLNLPALHKNEEAFMYVYVFYEYSKLTFSLKIIKY